MDVAEITKENILRIILLPSGGSPQDPYLTPGGWMLLRDFEVLCCLEAFRILNLGQVWAAFFSKVPLMETKHLFLGGQRTTRGMVNHAYKRLLILRERGYVDYTYQHRLPHIYRLSVHGYEFLKTLGLSRYNKPPAWPFDLRHSLLVSGLALYFSKILGLEVLSERRLLCEAWLQKQGKQFSSRGMLPDLKVRRGEMEYRVELELSEKEQSRYLTAWEKLDPLLREDEPYVLYVVDRGSLAEKLLRLTKTGYFPGVYFVELQSFLDRLPCPVWRNFQGREFQFTAGRPGGPAGSP